MTVLGLAFSVGASGALISPQSASAANSEARGAEEPAVVLPQAAQKDQAIADAGTVPIQAPSKAVPTPASNAQTIAVTHVVREGDTIWSLAERYEAKPDDIVRINSVDADSLRVGQVIDILTTERKRKLSKAVPLVPDAQSQAVTPHRNLAQIQVQQAADSLAQPLDGNVAPEPQDLHKENSSLTSSDVSQGMSSEAATVVPNGVSTPVPVSTIVPGAELETASEGPQQSEQIVADASVISALPERSVSGLQSGTHVIGVGETVSSIARMYDVSTQELVELNGLRNPNRVFVGQTLKLPATPQPAASAPQAVADEAVHVAASQPVALLSNEAVDSSAAPSLEQPRAPQPEASAPQVAEPESEANSEVTVASIAAANPYTEDLIGDIEDIAEDAISDADEAVVDEEGAIKDADEAVANEAVTNEAVVDEAELDASEAEDADAINSEFVAARTAAGNAQTTRDVEVSPTPTASDQATDLVARAPLGSPGYVPLAEPVTGRMVSPELPPLSDSEDHLPGASTPLNGYVWPAQGLLTSGYGWRWGRMHKGIDVAAPVGTPVVAAAPGVIEFSGWNSGGYGNMVDIRHPDGNKTRYAHNSRNLVRVGQKVEQGQQIAEMGSTGYSTGPHVHFEIHLPNQGAVNPVAMLSER